MPLAETRPAGAALCACLDSLFGGRDDRASLGIAYRAGVRAFEIWDWRGRELDAFRTAREEFKRHAKEPDWKQLQQMVAKPLIELRDRVAEEVRKRDTPDALVPIDRDPVPPEFIVGVRRYYERLGSGR